MKRIAFLKPRASGRGGLEKYTRFLIQAFVDKGCPVTLLTTGTPPQMEGVHTLSLCPDSKISLLQLLRFDALCNQWLHKNTQEIIFGMERTTHQTHYRAGSGVHAAYLQRRQIVDPLWKRWTHPLNPLQRCLLSMERKAFESPHLKTLFTNSFMVRQEVLDFYHTPPEKIQVVHNGVEWRAWEEPFAQSLKRQKGPFHFLFVGNGYLRKGLSFLLQGMALLKHQEFVLTIIGKERNINYFISLAQQLGLHNKIRFVGPQHNVIPFYQEADALVLPSIYDPFANVTVEALAMGLFVVTSFFNGGKEILSKESGILIEELTVAESVASALQSALEYPKSETSSIKIRNSIKKLDFSLQLDKIVTNTLNQI